MEETDREEDAKGEQGGVEKCERERQAEALSGFYYLRVMQSLG